MVISASQTKTMQKTLYILAVQLAIMVNFSSATHHMYDLNDHPLNYLPLFSRSNSTITPVVMNRYYISHKYVGPRSAVASLFAPKSANYVHHDNGAPFVTNADAFVVGEHFPNAKSDPKDFGKIHLNYYVRVFAIMFSFHNFYHPPHPGFSPNMTGMPEGWKIIGAVRTFTGYDEHLGYSERHPHGRPKLPKRALAVEAYLHPSNGSETDGYILRFPHPWSMRMNGDRVRTIAFLFVPHQGQEETVHDLQPFPELSLPDTFLSFSPDGEEPHMVYPDQDPPVPNKTCPKWLHDIHVTSLRRRWDGSEIHDDEPSYWRTWHPAIDQIYWCYYDHEHGSYPGKLYRPAFGYTAWKTKDDSTVHGRQNESHEGFKIYALPLKRDRLVVITAHMHISKANRFTTRFHSLMFAVLRGHGADQRVEVEMSFKSDYGPAMAQNRLGVPIPLDDVQGKIKHEMTVRASRIFNVINIDEKFPRSLDPKFRVKGSLSRGPARILNGLYENWRTTFPSCTTPRNIRDGAFQFDVRDPSTAARFPVGTTDENIQVMNGFSLRRLLVIGYPITFSLSECADDMQVQVDEEEGLFFTDSYFQNIQPASGAFRIRQFISSSVSNIVLNGGFYRADDPWSGVYIKGGTPGLQHIEGAILKMRN